VIQQLPLELGHRAALGRDDFLVSESNRDAVAWIDLWPDWPAPGLVVFGPAASGKSHLAEVWRARSDAMRLDRAELAPDSIGPLAATSAVVIENADQGIDETALFHLYNIIAERSGSLLLTASMPPARWGLRLADLRSRLAALPAVAIAAPDDALMQAVLVKLFSDRQLRVDPELVAYLATRLDRSLAAAAAAVAILDRAALAARRPLTIPFARDALRAAAMLS
jgi:chromosomal replication initiation ATPase DnaA